MQTLTNLISTPITAIIIALILVGSITLHAYWKYKNESIKPLMPNTCALIHKEIYLLNQEIDETSDTERLEVLTKRLLNLEEHLTSLHDYYR